MTPRQAAAIARLSAFVDAYDNYGENVESVYKVYNYDGDRCERIQLSDLRTLLAMASDTPTPGDPKQ